MTRTLDGLRDRAAEGGGAFVSAFADAAIGGSTISGNVAALGGEIHAEGSADLFSSNGRREPGGRGRRWMRLDGPGDLVGVDPMLGRLRQNGGHADARDR